MSENEWEKKYLHLLRKYRKLKSLIQRAACGETIMEDEANDALDEVSDD